MIAGLGRTLAASVLVVCVIQLASAAVAPSALAAEQPEWTIASMSEPTNLAPGSTGDLYIVTVTNTGGASTDGSPVVISDTLPAGLVVTSATGADEGRDRAPLPCEQVAATVTCRDSGVVTPGDALAMNITVNVVAGASGELVSNLEALGGGATGVSSTSTALSSASPSAFGFSNAITALSTSQAGAHPNFTTIFSLNENEVGVSADNVKHIKMSFSPGLVGDSQATPRCTPGQVIAQSCPSDAIVGIANLILGTQVDTALVYNIVPEADEPAAYEFVVLIGYPIRIDTSLGLNASGEHALSISLSDMPESVAIALASVTFWGVPADFNGPGVDSVSLARGPQSYGGPADATRRALMTNPSTCLGAPLLTTMVMEQWQDPSAPPVSSAPSSPATAGCDALSFDPTITALPDTTQAGAPAGYEVDMDIPQAEDPSASSTPDLKRVVMTLPTGTVVSPSAASGIKGCSDNPSSAAGDEFGLHSDVPAACPSSSQIGTVSIETPLLAAPMQGRLFLGEPQCAPCSPTQAREGQLLRLLLQAQGGGIIIKLEGVVTVNQSDGQLTTTFIDTPQLPFDNLKLSFNGGSRAPLVNPQTCGQPETTNSDFTPWATPFVPDATPTSSFEVANCPPPRFVPGFSAGTLSSQAGAFSPFTMTLSRTAEDQDFSGIQVQLPEGLLGKLSQVPLCPEWLARSGLCDPGSLIGHATAVAGPGGSPLYLGGQVFLTGPYRGAPFGLSVLLPAKAGPFDLGNVVLRAAITIDPRTAALTITSDPFPQSQDGIPLAVQGLNVVVDRPDFIFNPTSCGPLRIGATVRSAGDITAAASSKFEAAGCDALPFKPVFSVSARGGTDRRRGASLDVKLLSPKGVQANIRSIRVVLPKQLPARLTTIQRSCRDSVFNANPAACPATSVVGVVKATTPALAVPATGPVYLVSHGGAAFPDLVVLLQGDGVLLALDGSLNISSKGITSSTFASVPDVPITSFELNLPQGPNSAFAANGSLCPLRLVMPSRIIAQNGAVTKQSTKVTPTGCPKPRKPTRKPIRRQAKKSGHGASSRGRGR